MSKSVNLCYDMIGAFYSGAKNHPQNEIKNLGIEYKDAEPNTMNDSWTFFDCANLPNELPSFLKVVNG